MNTEHDESELSAHEVVRYLVEHPAVLLEHPNVVRTLEIPHECGTAVSLVEHQLGALKDDNRRLRRKLRELVDNARTNEQRVHRLLRLSLSLLDCQRFGDVINRLNSSLCDDFQIDVARMRLFGNPSVIPMPDGASFVAMDDDIDRLFKHVLHAGTPVCGRLRPEQLDFLFGEQRDSIGSSALLPLGDREPLGLLAIGSHDPQRFHPAQGTDFLEKVGELVTRAISAHLAAA